MSDISRVLVTSQEIDDRLAELAAQIDADYGGKQIVLVGVLNGAVMVMAERGFAAFIGDIHRLSVSRAIVVRRRVMAVTVVMVVSQIGCVFIGNARELKAVFDPVLIILHAMHLHRDHYGYRHQRYRESAGQRYVLRNRR